MLTGMRLGNFKAFGPTQHIPIRPITLIFGPNSGGKSSLIHGLLLQQHAISTGQLDVHQTSLGGDSVDLGGFRQYVHQRRINRQVVWGAEIDRLRLDLSSQSASRATYLQQTFERYRMGFAVTIGMELDDQGQPREHSTPVVTSFDILADGESILRMSRRSSGTMSLDQIELTHDIFARIIHSAVEAVERHPTQASVDEAQQAASRLILQTEYRVKTLFPVAVQTTASLDFPHDVLDESEQDAPIPTLGERAAIDVSAHLNVLLEQVSIVFADEFDDLRYLGPLRSYPARRLSSLQQHDSNWDAGGGFAWDEVRDSVRVRRLVNAWLGDNDRLKTHYELKVHEYIVQSDLEPIMSKRLRQTFEEATTLVLDDLWNESSDRDSIRESLPDRLVNILDWDIEATRLQESIEGADIERIRELVLEDLRSGTIVSHRDVGIGISQVLPVLVNAYAFSNSLIAIEQPEIHLHPALQAELGDVFIRSALDEQHNTFILETHSEHLILRIMRRMRDTVNGTLPDDLPPVRPQDVAILYVEPVGSASRVHEIRLDNEGGLLSPWPGGFFEEGFQERFS